MRHSLHGLAHGSDSSRPVRGVPQRRVGPPADYTIAHAGRQLRLGPITFWIGVGTLVIMAGWTLATGTYFAFHDDVLTRLMARQKEQQFAYEDRIAELRAQVDRITSRQLLNQEQFEQKLNDIVRRQAVLEQRAATLAGVPDATTTGSIRGSRPTPLPEPRSGDKAKASPISLSVPATVPAGRDGWLMRRAAAKAAAGGVEAVLARLEASLDRVDARQAATLNTLQDRFDSKAKRISSVLADLGMDTKRIAASAERGAVGGPFVPVTLRKDAGAFERQLYRTYVARAHVDRLARTLRAVPVRKPLPGEIDLSSGFGVRTDPFIGRPAMHTGLDMRSSIGELVHATADGVVEIAGWNGGYGKMVEVDHGNGFATRYGHLSEIDVKVGQRVKIGQVIGRVGSTGRSTGPHLHYETRIDGEAVDPQRFLRAGLRLGDAL